MLKLLKMLKQILKPLNSYNNLTFNNMIKNNYKKKFCNIVEI